MSLSDDEERVLLELEREFTGRRLPEMPPRRLAAPAVSLGLVVLGSLAFGGGLLIGVGGVVLAIVGYVLIVAGLASAVDRCRVRRTGSDLADRLVGRQLRTWQKRSRS